MRATEFIYETDLDPRGWGETPMGTDVDYFGLKVKMRPSMFLKLAAPLSDSAENPEVEKYMRGGGKIAYPWLEIREPREWEDGDFSKKAQVVGHEGRNRMKTWIKLKGDEPIQVNLFLKGANRRRYITSDMIEQLSRGVTAEKSSEFVKGPLFDPSTALEEEVSNAGASSPQGWMGDEMYRHLVELDDLEEGWKDWVAGAAIGAAALSPNIGQSKQAHVKPAVKPAVTQQVQKATPLTNNQLEKILITTAKKSGLKGTELAQFLAQMKHESWDFSRMKEKGGSLDFRKYDPKYAPKTAKILGNKHAGDGQKYHGRGFIQLTGRDNYRMAQDALGIPLLKHPELAEKPEVAAQIALWYWNTRVKDHVVNFADTPSVTKYINPAMRGLENRQANFNDYASRKV